MHRFETTLRPGRKAPYDTWTFVELPATVAAALGAGPVNVRGTIGGVAFRGTATRGEGRMRVPMTRAFLDQAAVARGDRVAVTIERDPEPRPVVIPTELQAVLDADPKLAALFEAMAPSHRRAWAAYVAEAKRPATRARRAALAPAGIRARAFPGR